MTETTNERYPEEILGEDDDDGTMPENVAKLSESVVGRRIVSVEKAKVPGAWGWSLKTDALVITLDDGTRVEMVDGGDCCAYTELADFWVNPAAVDHVITGVGTTDGYTTWHIYADLTDVLKLDVAWSPGNPFYYGYGFHIRVVEPS